MSCLKQSGPFIPWPRIENQTSKKTSDLIGGQLMKGTISMVLFVCLKEKVSPVISICSHIVRGSEKYSNVCAWVRVRFQEKKLTVV